jgi:hypothetical protein
MLRAPRGDHTIIAGYLADMGLLHLSQAYTNDAVPYVEGKTADSMQETSDTGEANDITRPWMECKV